jgi:hypothetical protein
MESSADKQLSERNSYLEKYIADRRIDGTLREQILDLKPNDGQALLSLIKHSEPSANSLREMLRWASEVAARDKTSLADVLTQASISQLLEQEGLSRKDKQRLLKREIQGLRFPERRRLQERAQELCREIVRDTGLKLELPKDFEGGTITVCISERDIDGFAKASTKVKKLSEHSSCIALFNLLNGIE